MMKEKMQGMLSPQTHSMKKTKQMKSASALKLAMNKAPRVNTVQNQKTNLR